MAIEIIYNSGTNKDKSAEVGLIYCPLVSVIVITYNSEKFVKETLDSVASQNYSNIELIVTDDCSSDETVNICRNWLEDKKQSFVSVTLITSDINTGISPNINRGIKVAKGEWIKGIAGDDKLTSDCINIYINYIKVNKDKDIHLLHGSARMFQDTFEEKNFLGKWGAAEWKFNNYDITPENQYKSLLRACPILAPTVLIKKCIFDKVGYYDEEFPFWEDRPMWLKLTKAGYKFYFLNAELAAYRLHSKSIQNNDSDDFFSKYLLLRDKAYLKIILPNLPPFERFINWYIIIIRQKMVRFGFNKNTKITRMLYRGFTHFAVKILNRMNGKFVDNKVVEM
ncbi:MAG: glycosyltransferase [Bacteroidales bacterium]|nr:glycosyltransferase [Bacteroidales bacterium]